MKRLSTIVVPILLFNLLITTSGSIAQSVKNSTQQSSGFCGHNWVTNSKHFPKKIHDKLEQRIYDAFQKGNPDSYRDGKSNQVPDYVLPIVVHIIHNNGAENISDATVLQGISDLNDAFANTGYYDPTTGVDTKIQFCLAQRDPDGNATTGIDRVQSTLTDMTLESDDIPVKDLSRWNPMDYVNIWLVREICSNAYGCGVAGYAYLPSSHGQPEDGIVMEAEYFGSAPGASGVQIHEMGHYLGLYHTFEGGCTNDDCLADGDRVCDTPPDQSTASVPCNAAPNSCNTDTDSGPFGTDQPDLFQDYMDYGDFNCYSIFTEGQTERMSWFIENVRFSLLESQGCLDPCTSGLIASFSAPSTTVNAGTVVNFTNTSVNATLANWRVDGLFFSSAINANYTFNSVGTFEICLTADNADPNCSDKFCQTFIVHCPAQASFTANVFYPMPGETVNYVNTSTSATTFQWKVNGVVQATSANFSTSFPSVGVYEVCLTAGNNSCSDEFCMSAFVTTALPPGQCDTSFLKIYGTPQDDEIGLCMTAVPTALGGGYLIGGGKGDSAMLTLLDANANIVWTRAFDATPFEADYIWDLKFDSENRVFGSGQSKPEPNDNIECFAFRYNMVTNTILWINELDLNDPAEEIYYSVLEKSPGGNYIVAGQVTQNLGAGGGTGCDGIILELNRNTGANVWQENYTLGSCETFQRTIIYNNNIYSTGRYNFDATGTARMRPGITKMDMTGNQIWSRLYLRAVTAATNARLLSSDIIADNGLVVLAHGDKSGTSTTNVNLFLYRTDTDGEIEWAMEYDIPGALSETTTRLYNLPDGYLCLGFFTAGNQDAFIFKTDKQGQLQWARAYGSNELEDARDLIVNNGVIYFTGKSDGLGNSGTSEDLFLASLTLDGSSTAQDSCNFFKVLDMTAVSFANPYEAQHDLTNLNLNWGNFIGTTGVGQTSVQSVTACIQTCVDSCDLVPDAVFQNATASCLGDSLLVMLNVCNEGNFPLPAGTPLTFYLGNPATSSPAEAGTFTLPADVKKDSCETFQFTIAAAPNMTIFVMVNDDGTTPTPFTLATFESDEMECDYTNNLGSFITFFTPPVLNLGPNTTMCEFGVVVLDAGANFTGFEWQDGSSEQTYTVFNPGTYSVTVTDACGGTQTDQITITVDPATVLDLGPDLEICQGGSYDFNVTGFSTFVWSPAGDLSCTNCPDPTLTPLTNATYVLIATNAEGCIGVDSITVTVTPPLQTVESVVICQGSTVIIFGMPVSAEGEFTEVFSSIEGCDSIHTVFVTVTPAIETAENVEICEGSTVLIFGMPVSAAGVFTQAFSTAEDCDSIHTVTVSVLPNAFSQQSISICVGETADIFGVPTGTAGVYEMTFTGSNGCDSTHAITLTVLPVTSTSESISICDGESILIFGNAVSTAGVYSETFTGSNGCDSTHTVTLTLLPNTATSESIFICFGETANIFGTPVSTAGTYSMTFAAANGCDSVHTIVLLVNPAISIGFSGTNVSCFGGSNGSVTASVSGGSGGFIFNWASGETTPSLSNLSAGTYILTVTDSEFCAATASVNLSQPAAVTPVATGVNVSCTVLGSVSCSVTGGTGAYSFLWNNGATTASVSGLTAGTYAVTVTDANNCTGTASVQLTGGLGPQVSITVDVPLTLADPDIGALTAVITGGTAPIGIEWSNGESSVSIDGLSSGDYYVTLTDVNGCTASAVAHLFLPACTGGKIWNDMDRDGCQDPGEIGFANVELTLTGTDIWGGSVSAMTTTTSNIGEYIFENLPPGNFQVSMSEPANYDISPIDACGDDSQDSDFAPGSAMTVDDIVLVEGHCCLTVDCGVYESCLNVTNPGVLCCNQNLCGPGDPALISGTPATGSAGAVSYLWMYSHTPGTFDPGTWLPVIGVNGLPVTTMSYNPGILSQTTYFIRCVIGAGCADWLESNPVSITIGNVAVADIQQPGAICVNDPETMSAFPNPAGATYLWNFGPWATPSTSTLQSVPVSWNQAGYTNISLAVTYNGCTSTDAMTIAVSSNPAYCANSLIVPGNSVELVEMVELEAPHSSLSNAGGRFRTYPNPVNDRLTIEWGEAIETAVEVKIVSVEGRLLHVGQSGEGDLQYAVDLSGWQPGIYLLRLRHGDGEQVVFKLVKQ